jgi:hypothetical protein
LASKDINSQISNILQDHRLLSTANTNNTVLKTVTFDIIDEPVKLDFRSDQNQQICDSIIRVCDENLISRDGYRRLAAVNPDMEREYAIEDRRAFIEKQMNDVIPIHTFDIEAPSIDETNNETYNTQEDVENIEFNDNEVGNCVYRSILSLLHILVPILSTSNPCILNYGDTINLKLGGDGRNVGRAQNHVMLTLCILNESEDVLKPDRQYR